MRQYTFFLFGIIFFTIISCDEKKYEPVSIEGDNHLDTLQKNLPQEKGFSIAYKQDRNGIKTIHVKLNDVASFDAIFDTGCSGLLISLQEAMSLIKSGTLDQNDSIGIQSNSIANGDVIKNYVFNIHEVTLVDTKGRMHTIYDVPASIVENPKADVLVGNAVIDQFADYEYGVDLQRRVINFR